VDAKERVRVEWTNLEVEGEAENYFAGFEASKCASTDVFEL